MDVFSIHFNYRWYQFHSLVLESSINVAIGKWHSNSKWADWIPKWRYNSPFKWLFTHKIISSTQISANKINMIMIIVDEKEKKENHIHAYKVSECFFFRIAVVNGVLITYIWRWNIVRKSTSESVTPFQTHIKPNPIS